MIQLGGKYAFLYQLGRKYAFFPFFHQHDIGPYLCQTEKHTPLLKILGLFPLRIEEIA